MWTWIFPRIPWVFSDIFSLVYKTYSYSINVQEVFILTLLGSASVVDSNSNCLLFGTEVHTTDYEPKLVINCFERISQNTLVCNMLAFVSQVQNNWHLTPNLPFASDMLCAVGLKCLCKTHIGSSGSKHGHNPSPPGFSHFPSLLSSYENVQVSFWSRLMPL